MSMLTGRHPYENDCWTNNGEKNQVSVDIAQNMRRRFNADAANPGCLPFVDHLETGIPTFAHSLGAAGYRPVLAGR
eukprot:SAG31_NODE_3006_length_4794_cov_3.365495_12_plen_76_part_00